VLTPTVSNARNATKNSFLVGDSSLVTKAHTHESRCPLLAFPLGFPPMLVVLAYIVLGYFALLIVGGLLTVVVHP
jgi:hypothetical protein